MQLSKLLLSLPLAGALPTHPTTSDAALDKRLWFKNLKANAQFNFEPFLLQNIRLGCHRQSADELYSCKLKFYWHDPNSVRQNNVTSCTCSSEWVWDGVTSANGENNNYTTEYVTCLNAPPSYFAMKFDSFDSAQNFTLDLAHRYKDSENFTAPYIYPTTFAMPTLRPWVIERSETTLELFEPGPIKAEVVGVSD
ncbi:hypothetical protein VTK73DRAFT_3768 [Phialemonium thermophilum]|uniref:Uncharacterized protein n=1 Tax=Phialemonium thermophilum TaxID=223376 RepID=A0ABR3WXS2_9PEZI